MARTKNKLTDLNDHLFLQLERLNDEDLKGDALEEELKRADSISKVASQIVQNANTILRAAKFQDDRMNADDHTAQLLIGDGSNEK